MRQWAHSELDSSPFGRPSGKRRPRVGGSMSLQQLSTNNLQLLGRSPGEEDTPPVRLSRHIPQREAMDMVVSAYNLTTQTTTTSTINTTTGGGGCAAAAAAAGGGGGGGGVVGGTVGNGGGGGLSLPHSTMTSYSSAFSESLVSDDSSYVTSIYNEVLAEQLSSESTQRHRKIGGDVLRFDTTDSLHGCKGASKAGGAASSCRTKGGMPSECHASTSAGRRLNSPLFTSPSVGSAFLMKRVRPIRPTTQRVLYTNPERVLDAPEFPVDATQLLHWGSNNQIIIGLKNCLYGWNSETGQASRIVQLQDSMRIHAVHWLHKCTCVALALDEGVTAIYDCRHEEFLRTVRGGIPPGAEFTHLAVNGPLLAIGTSTRSGGVYVFDLRAKEALISVYEGHTGGITSLNYCTDEPFYLASGGADGAVRVWDARRSSCPRYAFDHVHQGAVNAILWNPDKRSKMYTGGQDGMLCYVDTHAPMTNVPAVMRGDEEGPTTGVHFVTRAIATMHPISGIVSPPGVGELATSHRGKGHVQVRQSTNFHLIGALNSPNSSAGISCMTLAPDLIRICAAQDETLKFWRAFESSAPLQRSKSATPPPPVSLLEEELR